MSTRRCPGRRSSTLPSACAGTGSHGWPARCPATTDDLRYLPTRPIRRQWPRRNRPARLHNEADPMSRTASTDIVMAAFAAVELRDEPRLAELYHPEVEFHWPPSLPSAGAVPRRPPG